MFSKVYIMYPTYTYVICSQIISANNVLVGTRMYAYVAGVVYITNQFRFVISFVIDIIVLSNVD